MKAKLGIPKGRPLADFLPTITITAKNLATEITNFNVIKEELHGESRITGEHMKNNADIRLLLKNKGIMPENLPPEEDIKKVQQKEIVKELTALMNPGFKMGKITAKSRDEVHER